MPSRQIFFDTFFLTGCYVIWVFHLQTWR